MNSTPGRSGMRARGTARVLKRTGATPDLSPPQSAGTGAKAPAAPSGPVRPRQAACGRSVASAAPPARFSALTIALIDAVTMFSSMPTP